MKIEGLSPVPCPSTLWGKRVDGIHLMLSQLCRANSPAIDSQTRAFCELCLAPCLLTPSVPGS